MERFDYVIVGGGMVADAAARGIRELDTVGSIGVFSADADEPYARPALSKKLWTDPDFTWEKVPLGTAADTGADIRLNTLVTSIDRVGKSVTLGSGESVEYDRLLLATGATPRTLDTPESDRIIYFRSADDYRTLRSLANDGAHVVVAGGGYIASEIAASLATNGVSVDLIYPHSVLGSSRFTAEIARRFEALFVEGGVNLVRERRVDSVSESSEGVEVVLDDGVKMSADAVVFGLGADPVVALAEDAGLVVDDGVVVDETLKTSDGSVWAAGDIARYPDPILGSTRVEHVDNAKEMGAAAGRSLAGADEPYSHTPYFYSQVFGTRWEAVGTLDPEGDILQINLDDDRAVVYYRDDEGKPVGVLLWQVEDARDAARQVLADAPTDEAALAQRIS
ncbi:NAD(P)/FAD-dependent oxidoreductase [Microbacterium halimionae]|nr:FAD/NAD(P)-binding oxidoreductase [Microbacterium halimionae]